MNTRCKAILFSAWISSCTLPPLLKNRKEVAAFKLTLPQKTRETGLSSCKWKPVFGSLTWQEMHITFSCLPNASPHAWHTLGKNKFKTSLTHKGDCIMYLFSDNNPFEDKQLSFLLKSDGQLFFSRPSNPNKHTMKKFFILLGFVQIL